MLGIISSNLGMLIAMWVVLVLVGLTVLINLVAALRGPVTGDLSEVMTKPVLQDIFPLIVLSWLTALDPTKVIVLIAWYVMALLIAVKALMKLANLLQK